jgi:hypothetical protein
VGLQTIKEFLLLNIIVPWTWTDSLAQHKHWKNMRFGAWNIRSLCRRGAIKSVVGELEKLDLMGVQEVRWEVEGYQTADNYTFFMQKAVLITN